MKKAFILLMSLLYVTLLNAQSNKKEIDLMQSIFGMEKKAIVAEFVKVDPAQQDAFWKLYDEYEATRKELGAKRIELLLQYTDNYGKMTNETADSWTKQAVNLGKKTDALLLKYCNKVKKITNPVIALQFYQVESYILTGIRLSIMEELPLPDVE